MRCSFADAAGGDVGFLVAVGNVAVEETDALILRALIYESRIHGLEKGEQMCIRECYAFWKVVTFLESRHGEMSGGRGLREVDGKKERKRLCCDEVEVRI